MFKSERKFNVHRSPTNGCFLEPFRSPFTGASRDMEGEAAVGRIRVMRVVKISHLGGGVPMASTIKLGPRARNQELRVACSCRSIAVPQPAISQAPVAEIRGALRYWRRRWNGARKLHGGL